MLGSGICFNSDVDLSRQVLAASVLLIVGAVVGVSLIVGDGEGPRESEVRVTEFAPVRAYAGLGVQTQTWSDGSQRAVVSSVQEGGPAAKAGLLDGADVVTMINGQPVSTAPDVYAAIERAKPGDTIEVVVERFLPDEEGRGPTEDDGVAVALTIGLVEEPPPSGEPSGPFYTEVDYEDQLRMGIFVAPITQQVADLFGITDPTGVLVRDSLHFFRESAEKIEPGDVIVRFNGRQVYSMENLQELIRRAPENRRIEVGLRRGNQTLAVKLAPLGPNVPGVNHFPVGPRTRVQKALESGGLHASRLEDSVRRDLRGSVPGRESGSRIGIITKLGASSITIQMYASGDRWTLKLTPQTRWTPGTDTRTRPQDLRVGDFVELGTQDGETAFWVGDLSVPLPNH